MGFGMPGAVWGPQVDELQSDHRCCHYDHLGVGESDRGPFLRTIPAMADDAVRILDDLSWDRAHVVGVSMGGMIAQELALRSSDRCQSLTLVATHGGAPVASFPTLRGMTVLPSGSVWRSEEPDALVATPALSRRVPRIDRARGDRFTSRRAPRASARPSDGVGPTLCGDEALDRVSSFANRAADPSRSSWKGHSDSADADRPAGRANSERPRTAVRRRGARGDLSERRRSSTQHCASTSRNTVPIDQAPLHLSSPASRTPR